jgi:E3 ubiquitin-protein ligase TRIP12
LISKIDKRSFLELEFQGEEGTGLGPTLEFYDNIAEEFKKWSLKIAETQSLPNFEYKMWRHTQDNYLFPSPLTLKSIDFEVTK